MATHTYTHIHADKSTPQAVKELIKNAKHMSPHTYTYIRADKLTPQAVKELIKNAKHSAKNTPYYNYANEAWEDALNDWLQFNEKYRDYLVYECHVDPCKFERDYLIQELKHIITAFNLKMKYYDECLNGQMTFEDMLHECHKLKNTDVNFLTIWHNNHCFVNIQHEIFRNRQDSDNNFMTVDSLIEHCRNQEGKWFMDYDDYDGEYHVWTKSLEDKVRKYYSNIGDGNFIVQFM